MSISIYLVKGYEAHETTTLKAFLCPNKAIEWKDNYDGDEDFAFMSVNKMDIEDANDYQILHFGNDNDD